MVTRKEILHRYPFFRLSIPLILGIQAGMWLKPAFILPFPVILLFLFILWSLPFLSTSVFPYKFRWISGLLIVAFLAILSCEITLFNTGQPPGNCAQVLTLKERFYLGDIIEPVVQKTKSTKAILKVSAFLDNGKWKKVDVKVMVFIQPDKKSRNLFYGDQLVFSSLLAEPLLSVIPGSFDNRSFLHLRGIYFTAIIRQQHWSQIAVNRLNPVYHLALSWRGKLLNILRQHGLKGREFGVASALLLGYVDEVDNDLMKDYAATGVLHILSVSGMHVGMIFLVLEKLLGFLERWKYGRFLKISLSVLLIWAYALITGLSPAVLRAAAMLSLVIIGKSLKRSPDTLNILAASFFFLLIWDPKLLADMGFQLSYLAVVGIVLLYQPVYSLFVCTNWLLDKIWALVSVSIAAQLITTPLSMFYFHQFPNYFLLANIFVVPFCDLIIYTGILALVLSGVPYLSMVLAKALAWSVWILNGAIHIIGSLPGSVTHGLFIGKLGMVTIYGILITICLFIKLKQKRWLFLFLLLLVFFQGNLFLAKLKENHEKQFFVYSTKNSGIYDCIYHGSSILTGDVRMLENPVFADALKKCWEVLNTTGKYQLLFLPGIKNDKTFMDQGNFFKKGNFFQFHSKRFGILSRKLPHGTVGRLKLDYLIISGNPRIKLAEISRFYCANETIIDNSNSLWQVRQWVKEAVALHIKCHPVAIEGPFDAVF